MTKQLFKLLNELEIALRDAGLWDAETPSERALSSAVPFAVDTLRIEQWLQFIFIPKMTYLIENKQVLPEQLVIAPAVEMYLTVPSGKPIIAITQAIDNLFIKAEHLQ